MSTELEVQRHYERMEEIVKLYAQGNRLSDIQRITGLKRSEIEGHLKEFREYAEQDRVIRERAKEVVLVVDTHYSHIVGELYKAAEEADLNSDYKTKITALKTIADVEAKKVELLQKAGILAQNTIGDQIVESEKKQAALIKILKEVSSKCNNCKVEVAKRLSGVTGKIEPITVIDD